ncbi:ATP-binding protein [Pseudomonas sp. Sample_16]|uniref:ATP-binding protein n=1 Tax=Pseudomonas sp. Sample_16 TaxID=2448263 RepID=UPI001032F57E|nr:ATP-binding protein [Pseudomonas sp. Sample_16]
MQRKGFTLLEYFDDDLKINFFNEKPNASETVVSVIIGPNGSGKSIALSRIVEEFDYLASLKSKSKNSRVLRRTTSQTCFIRYQIDGVECQVVRKEAALKFHVNGQAVPSVRALPLPTQLAAVAHLPTDKFRFKRESANSFYKYLGLRQATNLTTTGALEAKVIMGLLRGLEKPDFKENLERWLNLAGYKAELALVITPHSDSMLSDDFETFEEAIIYRQPTGTISNSVIAGAKVAFEFFKRLKRELSNGSVFALDIYDIAQSNLKVWREGYEIARRLKAFSSVELYFHKTTGAGGVFQFSELSSGEQQIIGTHTRLLAEVESNSLVVIDEPELSLHPDWQQRYIPTLKACLEAVVGVHVLIATHSHFMVADVDDGNSSLVLSNKRNDADKWDFEFFDGDVYGRSPENILYRAFGVATSGNFYVENDLREALRIISMNENADKQRLEAIFGRLQRVCAPDNIAMNVILDRIYDVISGDIEGRS